MKMTKAFAALAALTMTCTMVPMHTMPETVITAGAQEDEPLTYDQLTYEVQEDGTISISGCAEDAVSVEIPSEINGMPVTDIGWCAFEDRTGLTDVTIPDGVTSIGGSAFEGCTGLTKITIPDSVTSIGAWAFEDCASLTDVTVPDSVTSIGYSAFTGTAWFNEQPEGVIYLGKWAYAYKGEMPEGTSIVLREGIAGIGDGVFAGCISLTAVTIPDSVTSIGDSAFENCTGLTVVTIPDGVTSIGNSAFAGCTGLTDIAVPDGVADIGSSAFSDTAWYNEQPDGLVYLGKWVYAYKGEMPEGTSLTLREGIAGICDSAFSGCTGLTSVNIPDGVTSIGGYAFHSCTGLTSVVIPDGVTGIEISAFANCTNLADITIPDSVTSIAIWAFGGCAALTDITIPASVESIGQEAFSRCAGLKNITILNPDCEIWDESTTIFQYTDLKDYGNGNLFMTEFYTGTITGYEGSTAQAYAEKYERTFVSLGSTPAGEQECGDIDGNGEVNAVDASFLLAAAALAGQGQPSGLTPAQETAADVDGKNGFNAVDASYILQYAAFVGNNPGTELDIKSFIADK